MVIARRPLVALLLLLLLLVALASATACNAVTGTGKYDIVDCPSGACTDGGGSAQGEAGSGDGATTGDGAPATDATLPLECTGGKAALTLTVSGSGGSVSAKSGGMLDVAAGETKSACMQGAVELRTSGSSATWSGVGCKDGPNGDRCEFEMPGSALSITAALH